MEPEGSDCSGKPQGPALWTATWALRVAWHNAAALASIGRAAPALT
jgi:hypothetical protein